MTRVEKRIIGECLRAAATGPFFRQAGPEPYGLVHTLMGVTHRRLVEIARAYPEVDGNDPEVVGAIIGSMNNLVGYPHGKDRVWRQYLSVSSKHVSELLDRWHDLEAFENGQDGFSGFRPG